MPYEVIEGAVPHKKKTYLPGDTIEGLSETDVERLLALGRIRSVKAAQPAPADPGNNSGKPKAETKKPADKSKTKK